jgi:hypothetical protein
MAEKMKRESGTALEIGNRVYIVKRRFCGRRSAAEAISAAVLNEAARLAGKSKKT